MNYFFSDAADDSSVDEIRLLIISKVKWQVCQNPFFLPHIPPQ